MSLFLPLALLSKGAKEKTLNEFLKALNDSSNKNLYLENLKEINTIIKNDKCLKITNSILSKIKLEENFLLKTKEFEVLLEQLENLKK